MLATLIPIFDDKMTVRAYSVFAQKDNLLLTPRMAAGGQFDGATSIPGLEIVNVMGIDSDTLYSDKEIFIELSNVSIFADVESQVKGPHDRIVFLLDHSIRPEEMYVKRVRQIKEKGFKIAIRKITIPEFNTYRPIIEQADYILLDHRKINIANGRGILKRLYPSAGLCAVSVDSQEDYDMLKETGGYDLYEGGFFRLPVVDKERETAPLKMTYIELMNVVNDPDFDLEDAAGVIGRDTALVLSLLEMVNHMTVNSEITSVQHAAAMLGQKELRKWINTVVTKALCADRPSEVTRMSLIRARFAENLAKLFELGGFSQELFLMGLFSVLDIILDKPIEEAVKMVKLSKNITDALVDGKGEFSTVYSLVKEYENASWQEVSRIMVLNGISMNDVYDAYVDALKWFGDLVR